MSGGDCVVRLRATQLASAISRGKELDRTALADSGVLQILKDFLDYPGTPFQRKQLALGILNNLTIDLKSYNKILERYGRCFYVIVVS
jgi:hypothetical protein